ncbi:MAG: hypothetical protein KBF62_00775 [Candidatus Pacebacteria bacterium]|nr:hypothetical protein [Candidatus Paceibacterota bacterium]MBP9058156.1 hypothetical protein [Candidatus Paceibacterota bacterium]MBP9770178.1 hypothetical protein [Candidatus Paceibacterota bacterium]
MFFNNKKKEIDLYVNTLIFRAEKIQNKEMRTFLYATLAVVEQVLKMLIVEKYNLAEEYLHESKSIQPLRDFKNQLDQQKINKIGNYIFLTLISILENKIDSVLLFNKLNFDRKNFNKEISLFLELDNEEKNVFNTIEQKAGVVNTDKFMSFYRWLSELILTESIRNPEDVASNAAGVLCEIIDTNLNRLRVLILK